MKQPRDLLVVVDDPTFCDVVEITLAEKGYLVVSETDARLALGLLRDGDFDAVLIDMVMPHLDGLELLDQIRQHFNVLPIVVVTDHGGAETPWKRCAGAPPTSSPSRSTLPCSTCAFAAPSISSRPGGWPTPTASPGSTTTVASRSGCSSRSSAPAATAASCRW